MYNRYELEDWEYRYEISAPSYTEAAKYAEVKGLRLREWNWKPDEQFQIRDKRHFNNECPICLDPMDYCQGHGEIGDPEGFRMLLDYYNEEQ